MSKKEIYVTKSVLPPIEEYKAEIASLWDSHWLTNRGEKSQKLEKKLKDYLQVEEVVLFCNGHLSLELALQSLNLSGEVITTPYTFASTTHAIIRNGLTPVFCDINQNDFTIDVAKIEALITDKTTAILPVHVYGNMCDVEGIQRIADKYDLKVIYDAAHAFGVEYQNKGIGTFGDASIFSFHATKVFHTIEGGCVTFNAAPEIKRVLNRLKNFGIQNETIVDMAGTNAKMNEFQAAMGLCNLRQVDEQRSQREKISQRYKELLTPIKGIQLMSENDPTVKSNYAYFPIIVKEGEYGLTRDELLEKFHAKKVFPRRYFYPITNMFDCYQEYYSCNETPIALSISQRVLTLPIYSELKLEDVTMICKIIRENYVG